MKKDMRDDILKTFKKEVTKNAKLPRSIDFFELEESDGKNKKVEMLLDQKAIGIGEDPHNMQTNEAAFEAWALLIHTHCGYDIQLSLEEDVLTEITKKTKRSGHYNRFLYRAMKFAEKYKAWFGLSDSLAKLVESFKEELFDSETKYYNNYPKGEASTGDSLENIVESKFAEEHKYKELLKKIITSHPNHTDLFIDSDKIFRQLPVGLFKCQKPDPDKELFSKPKIKLEKKVDKEQFLKSIKNLDNRFFTGGKSAIDLWTIVDETIVILELKSNNNMVGIITELMFYADYMYDMYIEKNNRFTPFSANEVIQSRRGYNYLVDKNPPFTKVQAFMLTDKLHPLITDKVIEEMNAGKPGIRYDSLKYILQGPSLSI